MKKVSLETSAQIQGGWSWRQHIGCALGAAVIGGGFGSAAAYVGCLLILDSNCSLCSGF